MKKLDIAVRRAIMLITGVIWIACGANYLLEWGVFRGFDKQAMVAGFIVFALALHFFWIPPDDLRAYLAGRRREK